MQEKLGMRHICESNVTLGKAYNVVELARVDIESVSISILNDGDQYLISFDNAKAQIRVHETGLLIRVISDDLVDCYGVKTLIVGHIRQHATDMPINILWVKGAETPFEAILSECRLFPE